MKADKTQAASEVSEEEQWNTQSLKVLTLQFDIV